LKWNIVDEKTAFSGFFRMVVYRIKHELFAGGFSETLEREVLQRGHAAAVLPYDAKSDSTLLIEQFRTGALENARGPYRALPDNLLPDTGGQFRNHCTLLGTV